MTTEYTLLSFFIRRRHIKFPENAATDALGFILNQSEATRKGFSKILQERIPNVSPIASVQNQLTEADSGTPDVTCFNEDGNLTALIEAKFLAKVREPHQPNSYWERLPRNEPSALVFLALTHSLGDLLDLLTRRLESVGFEPGEENHASGLITVPDMNSKRHLILISWSELLRRLKKSAKSGADTQALSELAQLSVVAVSASQIGICLCGCGEETKPKSRFVNGHDGRLTSNINRALRSLEPDYRPNPNALPLELPDILVRQAEADPSFMVVGYDAKAILAIAAKVGVR